MVERAVSVLSSQIPDGALATADIQPSSKGSIFNTVLPDAESNWFSTALEISHNGIMRVTAQVSVSGILRVSITRNSVAKSLNLNDNSALTASALCSFDIPVKVGDTFNLKYSTATGTIDYCEVQFIKGGV